MAAASPAVSDKSSTGTANNSPASSSRSISVQYPHLLEPPKQSLRGLNKPKCIKCGNIARARCPFQSCKGCCVKAENPCHIHVLKQQSILPDKAPSPPTSSFSEQPSAVNSSTAAALRLSSLRQLSNNFANSLRTKKPLSRKDAININKWRFAKLREYIDRDIEIENEAFDRYIQNVSLLEQTIFMDNKVVDDPMPNELPVLEQLTKDRFQKTVSTIKARLQSNTETTQSIRQKIQDIVDHGLKKLQKLDFEEDDDNDDKISHSDDLCIHREPKTRKRIIELRTERTSAVNDLLTKLSKARSDDDIKSCSEIKLKLFNQDVNKGHHTGAVQEAQQPSDPMLAISSFSLPKLCTKVQADQDILSNIEAQFATSEGLMKL